ncbi:hypothetical protein TI04_07905 [Achromatium sp. WMS2]|nr:hypothetical protein TI04_07905 [Achromatium sp. WMS2]
MTDMSQLILSNACARSYKTKKSLNFQGCSLIGAEADNIINRLAQIAASNTQESRWLESSGDIRLDRALGILLADMAHIFSVRPGFAFYDGIGDNNAMAYRQSYLPNTNGTVLFGRKLLTAELARDQNGDFTVMGICAHEFAHIVQYQYNVYNRLIHRQTTVKRAELHADFLAGYYIGRRNIRYSAAQLVTLGRAWEDLGDNNFSDPQHHGTREERVSAMEMGFRMAMRSQASLKQAITGGLYYLRA